MTEGPARRSIVAELSQLEERAVEGGIPPGARHRIAARLQDEAERRVAERAAPRRWLPAVTFAAGAALVMIVIGSGVRRPEAVLEETAAEPRMLGAWVVEGEDCRESMEGEEAVLRGRCRLVSDAMSIETWDETRLHDSAAGVRVLRGTAMFSVQKVAPGELPVRVEVSHGAIEVLGTRFTVQQDAGGGHVDLLEGRIRFVGSAGTTDVMPGERVGWGDRGSPSEDVASAMPEADDASGARAHDDELSAEHADTPAETAPATKRRQGADRIIEKVTALRARGRYRAAADVLRHALRRSWDRRTAEVLSYELGRILERQLKDPEAACAHWRKHAERFGGGRYADAVERGIARSCEA